MVLQLRERLGEQSLGRGKKRRRRWFACSLRAIEGERLSRPWEGTRGLGARRRRKPRGCQAQRVRERRIVVSCDSSEKGWRKELLSGDRNRVAVPAIDFN